ncbi:hypothetical protein MIZ03_4393 [Rhodoferax lithotrophicus]|nr:hypothetical protein MIZ03_4393 [Rhodoferax sp. MIZ03]
MYGPIRDIFIQVFGYIASDVDIDTAGEGGRPDVTARAPSGFVDSRDNPMKIDWVVVEAKDERGCFMSAKYREKIFGQKSKYVTADTAWFVMVEPDAWVIRPVAGVTLTSNADICIPLAGLTEQDMKTKASVLMASQAGVSERLNRFRQGDVSLIAIDKLSVDAASTPSEHVNNRITLNRRRFFQQIRQTTQHLQSAVSGAMGRLVPEIQKFQEMADKFWQDFDKADTCFDQHSLSLHGKPSGPDQSRQHDKESARLRREFAKNPHIARLAISGLNEFQARTGVDDAKLAELFSIETANLILARVLLLRFFEDHKFFGELKYVCNGGVDAFQKMRSYFKSSYTKLLEQAYQEGSRLYASAFDETELDWIVGSSDSTLSSAIELTLFRFAQFDFKTVKGDILTGIYDRFMDREQRKKLGEFYSPPSIARYMISRLAVTRETRSFDPSCGSGTFPIEIYRHMVGNDLDRGMAEYSDVVSVLERIAGNDLNTFSAVLAQIQILWQILSLKSDIEIHGFPDLLITAKVNSLVESDHWESLSRFTEIDQTKFDIVIGNPPYVRAERSSQALDKRSCLEFERPKSGFPGVSSKLNAYALFLYRALDRWCRSIDENGNAGKVAFILPVSLFDSNDTAQLRKLFEIGGRWRICEIVDLEIIWKSVFDAKAITAIFIAENRPAITSDTVSIRFADYSCVKITDLDSVPEFDIRSLKESIVPYEDLFSPDGRILTRMTPARVNILNKLQSAETFANIAKEFWVRKDGSRIVDWVDVKPINGVWESRTMISGGIAFRGSKPQCNDGMDVYKGENIVAAELQGVPALTQADMGLIDDIGLWKYSSIHPAQGLAVASVAHCPNGVMFDPKKLTFTNTVTILFPREEVALFPLDLLLLSNIYVWFYALAGRMGVLDTQRSHIYPTNLAFLPWNNNLIEVSENIEAMRGKIVSACVRRFNAAESIKSNLNLLGLDTFKNRLRDNNDALLAWGDNFSIPKHEVIIGNLSVTQHETMWRVQISNDFFDWVECNEQDISLGLAMALEQKIGECVGKSEILNMEIPVAATEITAWNQVIFDHQLSMIASEMEDALSTLDMVVGKALGLDEEDIQTIQGDLRTDPFLIGIRPRYPGTVTRKQGFRSGLDSEDRYS